MKASQIKSGMRFWDGSNIEVISETKCFITVRLSNGEEMGGRSVERKWKKSSIIEVA